MNNEGKIDKSWGFEIIWALTKDYCGKILVFTKPNTKTSMVFHKETTKSWFINSGKFIIRWIDTKTSITHEQILEEGKVWHIAKLVPYQLEAILPNSMIFEVGTSLNNDIYKIVSGDI